ncbi:MAG: ABC transporter ATP-binding protein [Variibacter sp.]
MSALLRVEGLSVQFPTDRGPVRAVEDLSFSVAAGETVAMVGESGSGKSTAALSLLRLIEPAGGQVSAGRILFDGIDLLALPPRQLRGVRGGRVGMIFQDPMMALNPIFTIGWQISEALREHLGLSRRAARDRTLELLQRVGIPAPGERIDQYPHNLSGGMRQRVMIAMALACRPSLLIADEPTTALDVTVQAQVLALINTLKDEFGMAVLLITHDLGVVWETAQRVVVMYAGRKVEEGSVADVFERPEHPYTRGLLKTARLSEDRAGPLVEIPGTVPNAFEMPRGCRFAPRCAQAFARCADGVPPDIEVAAGHDVACLLAERTS